MTTTPATTVRVFPFHHAETGTWSYVVADSDSRQAAIIDPVLDFDARTARIGQDSAQSLLDCVNEHGLQVPARLRPPLLHLFGLGTRLLLG